MSIDPKWCPIVGLWSTDLSFDKSHGRNGATQCACGWKKPPPREKTPDEIRLTLIEAGGYLATQRRPENGYLVDLVAKIERLTGHTFPCCERDHDHDGNCDRHPNGFPPRASDPWYPCDVCGALVRDGHECNP